jgi:hypothetical protein
VVDDAAAARSDTVPSDLRERVRAMMTAHWREVDGFGFTVPNATVYPWQWLWDSCFHSIIWAELGDAERAVRELQSLFAHQDDDGFVPHVIHHGNPDHHAEFWGRRGTSSITQPPMYGHAIAELVRRGVDVPHDLVERARLGLEFLLRRRARDEATGLITVVHPWETGADNSPRWDHFCPGGFDVARWKQVKGDLLATVERTPGGAPVANPAFPVGAVGFNALVVFNARAIGGRAELTTAAETVAMAVDARWDRAQQTWVDGGPSATGSGRARTADALLAILVAIEDDPVRGLGQVADPEAFGGRYGVRGVHVDDPAYAPTMYWRGPSWPQLAYLLWSRPLRDPGTDRYLIESTVAGARASGLAEYWDPEDGTGLGAIPQSWTGLALVMAGGTVAS